MMTTQASHASEAASFAVAEVSRILSEAVEKGQAFEIDTAAETREGQTVDGFAMPEFTGGKSIKITVRALPRE